jgi:hypothetical protein
MRRHGFVDGLDAPPDGFNKAICHSKAGLHRRRKGTGEMPVVLFAAIALFG